MRRGKATTLSDVAKEAGVAAMTVSVVLNGSRSATRVSEATRERIHEAAKRLHYRPNVLARGLSQRRMNALGVIANVDGGEINHYFLEMLNGVLEGARLHEQITTVFSVSDWQRDHERILSFCDGRVDGFLMIAPLLDQEFASKLSDQIPLAAVHPIYPYAHCSNILPDDAQGGYLATQYLISQGHRDIVHFSGPRHLTGPRQRYEGFLRAMQGANLPVTEESVIEGAFNIVSGHERIRHLIATRVDRLPTAIFAASDAIAYGCLEELESLGISVPDRISIIGFDDLMLARLTTPPLTTIRQPFREMGHRAVAQLLERVSATSASEKVGHGAHDMEATIELLDVSLVVRGSVKAISL